MFSFDIELQMASIAMKLLGLIQSLFSFLHSVLGRPLDLLTLFVGSALRAGSGSWVAKGLDQCKRPEVPLVLYEYEACPFCRKVREALSALAIDVIVYPCPRSTYKKYGSLEGSRFRGIVKKRTGKAMFPYLEDPNTGAAMNESSKILAYLWETYGHRATPPLDYRIGRTLLLPGLFLTGMCRPCPAHGMLRTPSKLPAKALELWGFEGSPFVRQVRETLCTLELKYILRQVAHGAKRGRSEFVARFGDKLSAGRRALGAIQVPLLVDPNTGREMLESADICAYLMQQYATGETINESAAMYSTEGASKSHFTIRFPWQKYTSVKND